jgi:hypothetical protein
MMPSSRRARALLDDVAELATAGDAELGIGAVQV